MTQYSIEQRTRKYVKRYGFLYMREIFQTNIENNYLIQD